MPDVFVCIMKEKTLLKLALFCVVVGLLGLLYISQKLVPTSIAIQSITAADAEKDVKVSGIVSKVTATDKATILEITEPKTITVVLFDNVVGVQKGDAVDVYGTVEEYNGRMEIIGNVVRLR
jgi:DNA/RNA endonuclease YhcR with UshA esterase domain